jgi:hypothetical protein
MYLMWRKRVKKEQAFEINEIFRHNSPITIISIIDHYIDLLLKNN